ncbi:hypothetical protein DFP88_102340 [Pseudoroseicyclus aestuarii]|uniref:Endonuclease/exonuclease/phosphatase domain-containing protein n=2 Tax=Pseudoroseicyclus aestuarii TaxID=1795041 RepID=A0A318SVZ0_9RHOB|nr:hypothetical protein DFP88_102340 [Pseudoroseicyclus aestuarii]
MAAAQVIRAADADILLLTGIDWDAGGAALGALAQLLAEEGGPAYPVRVARQPNSGMETGLDLDGNGRTHEARDAMGYGRFTGHGGLAVLARVPLAGPVRDLSDLLWRDLPGAVLPQRPDATPFPSEAAQAQQRLSSTGHWIVPFGGARPLSLLAFAATPPLFDGPEDANGLRNADELRLWQAVLDGAYGALPSPAVLAGKANIDPTDGDGRHEAIAALLTDPRLSDPRPASPGGAASADAGHAGDPALDTADWDPAAEGGPGNLRVAYVLPSADLRVVDAGVLWPEAGPLAEAAAEASAHRLVWVDLAP